jgi:hypothetical protein
LVKKKNLKAAIMKLDLSKAYNKVRWTFLRLTLIQMGLNLNTVNQIMGCLQSASFSELINDSPSHFFKASRGLRQGCPLSPFLFLIIAEALRKLIKEARNNDRLRGIMVSETKMVSHLLFVDDVFYNVSRSLRNLALLKRILDLYCKATRMMIDMDKSCILLNNCTEVELNSYLNLIPTQRKNIEEGVKYLGFCLKVDCYRKEDWGWLIHKVEKRISTWVYKTLSRGRLMLLKAILEGIPVYWNSIAAIPKGVLEKICTLSYQYLWVGQNLPEGIHLAKWHSIATPKEFGGWSLKDIRPFVRALADRNLSRLTQVNTLWTLVMNSKYFANLSIVEWFRRSVKSSKGSIV